MKSKLFFKLFVPSILTVFIVSGTTVAILVNVIEKNKIEQARENVALFVSTQADIHLQEGDFKTSDYAEAKKTFEDFFTHINTNEIVRIKVWDDKARVVFSKDIEKIGVFFPENIEYREAIAGNVVVMIKDKQELQNKYGGEEIEQLMEIYVPIRMNKLIDDRVDGIIEVYFSMKGINREIAIIERYIAAGSLASSVLLLALIFFILRSFVIRPIVEIERVATSIMSGDLTQRADIKTKDELGYLAIVFNEMVEKISKNKNEVEEVRKELEQERAGLELKVRDRTKQLEKARVELNGLLANKNKELEDKLEEVKKINSIIANRELRIAEMKSRIIELEKDR